MMPAYHIYRKIGSRFEDSVRDGAITDHWNVRDEAKAFLRLILSGYQTIERAKLDILMTQHQFEALLHARSGEFSVLQRIKWKREQTWNALVSMYRQATGKAVAA